MPAQEQPVAIKCPQCGAALNPGPADYLVCQYCGSSLIWKRQQASGPPTDQAVRGMRLAPFAAPDPEVTSLDIFQMLIPAGWQTRGGCRWLLDNPSMPAVVLFQTWNPRGGEAFEILPNLNFTWNTNTLTGMLKPPGSRYFGAEVRPPVDIQTAFRQFVLPRSRSALQDLRVIQFTPLPELPGLVKSEALVTPGASAEGGKIRFQYTWQGYPFEEEMYGVVEVFRMPIPGMFGVVELTLWFIDYLFSFRAAVGRLDATADLFSVMLQSFRLNPQWSAAVKTVAQQLSRMQIDHIRHVGDIGGILAAAGREAREQNLAEYYQRQSLHERIAVDRSRSIRSVEGYYDPHREEVVELPAGYGHAWANNLGEYIVTADPNFNPNQESGQHWEAMPPG